MELWGHTFVLTENTGTCTKAKHTTGDTNMKSTMKKLLAAGVMSSAVLLASYAHAATDGTLGATSTGTADVTLTIASQFRISDMDDFALGTYGGTGNLTANDDVCVYTNLASGAYNVTATDNSGMSAADFSVQNGGATADIPFEVRWNDVTGTVGNAVMTYNTQMAGTGANIQTDDCSVGGLSGNIQVTLLQAALQAAPADSYTSTVSFLIEP